MNIVFIYTIEKVPKKKKNVFIENVKIKKIKQVHVIFICNLLNGKKK